MVGYLKNFSSENVSKSLQLYRDRISSLESDILTCLSAQEDTFQAIYETLRDSDVLIINASGNSLKAAEWGLARYKQDKREVYSGDTAPGVSGLSGKKVTVVTVSGSGSEKALSDAAIWKKLREDYSEELDISYIGISTVPKTATYEPPLSNECDYYLVLTGNNKENKGSDEKDPGNFMGSEFELKAFLLLDYLFRITANEEGVTEAELKLGHNPVA